MAPTIPKEEINGKDVNSGDEEDAPETVSLLTPTTPVQVLPPTPTLGTSLSAPWRHHQGSAPSSPSNRRGAYALPKEPSASSSSSKTSSWRGPPSSPRGRPRSPCPSGRKAIRSAWLNEIENSRYNRSYAPVQLNKKVPNVDLSRMINLPEEPSSKTVARWIGVNGDHNHVHTVPTASEEPTSPHNRFEGIFQTPHIIVSPEIDDEEPLYPSGQDEDAKNTNSEQKDENCKSSTPAESTACKMDQNVSEENRLIDTEVTIEPSSLKYVDESQNKTDPKSDSDVLENKETVANYTGESSSSDNSPTDDQGQPYFCENGSPIEEPGQPEYRDITPSGRHRSDNNPFRSTSMASLDPNSDPFMRKTRRNSMIGMMRRHSSQSHDGSMCAIPMPGSMRRSHSKISFLVPPPQLDWREEMNESLILCVSALYAKLVVVMGMAFPIAEIISHDVPLIFYNSFYLYLYFGSILFLIYAYLFLLRTKSLTTDAFKSQVQSIKMKIPRLEVNWEEIPMPDKMRNLVPKKRDPDGKSEKADRVSVATSAYKPPKYTITETSNHGSMYLKMGAVIFGIGSMIYSGLEFGQYFELHSGANCANILMAISPVARMIFTFLQMYFIFLNSRVAISKHTIIARFGLMHMIGTNLCIWLNVLVQETKHEIAHLTHSADAGGADLYPGHAASTEKDHHEAVLGNSHLQVNDSLQHPNYAPLSHGELGEEHHVHRRSTETDDLSGCRRINLMGHVVSSASPFLFPCTIEYSLLCAGVLYVMWKNINVNKSERTALDGDSDISTFIARKVRHHYSVDCARASRGLFMGIFILVLTIISLILFYVLISNEQFKRFAILEANIIELSIYSLAIISVIVGMKQMRELEFILEGDIELDNILLIIAQAGVYIYTSFTIIGGYFSLQASHTLALLTAVMTLIQTTLQTLFILDGSRRCCYTADQLDRKPGREMVTFLLVCNLAMWAISTFETSRADVHPVQLHFYGIWAWTIISHVSMPLAIFYRFHVTVCLGEIWKRSYKLKNDFMSL